MTEEAKNIDELEKALNAFDMSFKNKSLLGQALVHSSLINENPCSNLQSNERLEFLGDAVLNLIVAQILYDEFPNSQEGELTRFRASLVDQETLAGLALSLKLGKYLLLGKGEETSGGREKQTILGDTFEAVLGAIFLDQNRDMKIAKDFVLRQIAPKLKEIKEHRTPPNYKTQLQEYAQKEYHRIPDYRPIEEKGPDHDKSFTVEVMLGERKLGEGSGKSKQEAEKEAARNAMEQLHKQK